MSSGAPSWITASVRLLTAVGVGAATTAAVAAARGDLPFGVLTGFAVMGLVYVVLGWVVLWPMDPTQTRANVTREDLSPIVDELVVVTAAIGGLTVVVTLLVVGDDAGNGSAALALVGVAMAWAGLHLMYATRYAYLFYEETAEPGGIDFNSDQPPAFSDFFYFSYNLGMTYAVSDTNVTRGSVRAVVLRHCLLSYVFGVAILATTLNLVIGALAS